MSLRHMLWSSDCVSLARGGRMNKTFKNLLTYLLVMAFVISMMPSGSVFAASGKSVLTVVLSKEGSAERINGAKVTYTVDAETRTSNLNHLGVLRAKKLGQLGKTYAIELPKALGLESFSKEDVAVVITDNAKDYAADKSLEHTVETDLTKEGGKVVVTLENELNANATLYVALKVKKSSYVKRASLMAAVDADGQTKRVANSKVTFTADGQEVTAATNHLGRVRVKSLSQLGQQFVVELPQSLGVQKLTNNDVAVVITNNVEDYYASKSVAHNVETALTAEGAKVVVTLENELKRTDEVYLAVRVKDSAFVKPVVAQKLVVAVERDANVRIAGAKVSYTENGEAVNQTTNAAGRVRVRTPKTFGKEFFVELPETLGLVNFDRENVFVSAANNPLELTVENNLVEEVKLLTEGNSSKVYVVLEDKAFEGETLYLSVRVKDNAFEAKYVDQKLVVGVELENNVRVKDAVVRYESNGEEVEKVSNAAGRVVSDEKNLGAKYVIEFPKDLGVKRLRPEDVYVSVSNGPENFKMISDLVKYVDLTLGTEGGKVEIMVLDEALQADILFVRVQFKATAFEVEADKEK